MPFNSIQHLEGSVIAAKGQWLPINQSIGNQQNNQIPIVLQYQIGKFDPPPKKKQLATWELLSKVKSNKQDRAAIEPTPQETWHCQKRTIFFH